MNVGITHGWVLLLLPLCVLPLLLRQPASLSYSALMLMPADLPSRLVAVGLRLVTCLLLAILIIALSGPYWREQRVQRIGEGAQIVLLLDRSRSMDQPFAGQALTTQLSERGTSKGTVARQLLSQFVAGRRNDMYSMVAFSARPIQVIPLTDKPAVIQAAIDAGNIGRGLSDTDVGQGIIAAVNLFAGQDFTGSRIVILISDGGARLDFATRAYIGDLLKRNRVALYWIYVRSRNSPGIDDGAAGQVADNAAPARALHEFFQSMDSPYRAFDAEDPTALAAAIEEINRLQSLPIRYEDITPRADIAGAFYLSAIALLLCLLLAELMEVRAWTDR